MLDYVLRQISDMFEAPCNWCREDHDIDTFMLEHCADWCEEHCEYPKEDCAECWRKYFETLAAMDIEYMKEHEETKANEDE